MNRKSLIAIVVFLLIGIGGTTFAQGNTVTFNNKPTQWYFNQDNFLVVQLANSPKPLIFGYLGKPFPGGTQTRSKMMLVDNDKQYSFEIMMPGDIWRPLTWDMLQCKDKDGRTCDPVVAPTPVAPTPPKQPDPPPPPPKPRKEEKFQCEMPWIGILGGAGLATLIPNKVSAETSNTKSEVDLGSDALQALGGAVIGAGLECGWDYLVWKHEQDKKAQQEAKQHKKKKHRD